MADKKISALTAATTPLAGTEVLPIVQSSTTVKVAVSDLTAGRDVAGLSFTGGNVKMSSNTITTTNAKGNLIIDPNGSGYTVITSVANGTIAQFGDTTSRSYYLKSANVTGYDNDTLVTESDSSVGQYQWKNSGSLLWTMSASGNLTPAVAAKGVNFTANTPAAGMTSQLLNWYEEGTWTPNDGSGAGLSFTSASGFYTRVGRAVTVMFTLIYPLTANANAARIGGLPFTSANTTSGFSAGSFTTNTSGQNVQPSIVLNDTKFAALLVATGTSATNAQLSTATLRGGFTYFV